MYRNNHRDIIRCTSMLIWERAPKTSEITCTLICTKHCSSSLRSHIFQISFYLIFLLMAQATSIRIIRLVVWLYDISYVGLPAGIHLFVKVILDLSSLELHQVCAATFVHYGQNHIVYMSSSEQLILQHCDIPSILFEPQLHGRPPITCCKVVANWQHHQYKSEHRGLQNVMTKPVSMEGLILDSHNKSLLTDQGF